MEPHVQIGRLVEVFSLHAFGSVPYFLELAAAKDPWIEAHENYQKQTFRNRYKISGANGVEQLTIHVQGQKGVKIPYQKIQLAHDFQPRLHKRAIQTAYGKSPFFEHYVDDIFDLLDEASTDLWTINWKSLEYFCEAFEIELPNVTTAFCAEPALDHRTNKFSLNHPPYPQLFEDRNGFTPGLSAMDLLFHLGPEAPVYFNT